MLFMPSDLVSGLKKSKKQLYGCLHFELVLEKITKNLPVSVMFLKAVSYSFICGFSTIKVRQPETPSLVCQLPEWPFGFVAFVVVVFLSTREMALCVSTSTPWRRRCCRPARRSRWAPRTRPPCRVSSSRGTCCRVACSAPAESSPGSPLSVHTRSQAHTLKQRGH